METLTDEIKNAIRNRLWYAALLLVLALPDVCARLNLKTGYLVATFIERGTILG